MDENNLDSLLDELSSMDEELNDNIDFDAGVDLEADDMDEISLDELDRLDSLDFGELDFDDIDFDDVDITKLDANATPVIQEKSAAEPEDISLDDLIERAEQEQATVAEPFHKDEVFGEAEKQMQEDTYNPEDIFDENLFAQMEESWKSDDKEGSPYTAGEASLDALLQSSMAESLLNGDLADIEDIGELTASTKKSGKRKKNRASQPKKTVSEILFGKPDEDDLKEEALYEEKQQKKAEAKQQKKSEREQKREEKNAAKQDLLAVKNNKSKEKQRLKQEKRRQQEAEYAAELEAEKNTKQVSTLSIVVVFVLFFALVVGVVLGTNQFSYSQVIKKATDYFERQRYRLAYDEVSGVEVKEEDRDLKDRIYTVMYVERLYESYENNQKLGRYDKALDALLRGLEKYDVHYDEAVELDIVKDIDTCRDKILNALWNTYGITESTAYQILAMEGHEYTKTLSEIGMQVLSTETPTDAQRKD